MDSSVMMYWLGLLVKLLVIAIVLRFCVWFVFYLVDRFLGVNISVTGWRIRGFETLHIKSPSLELQVNGFFVSLRWLDSSCRHFFKINVSGIHLEYIKIHSSVSKKKPAGEVKGKSAPSRKKRLLYWFLKRVLKLTEVSVKCLEVWTQDSSRAKASPIPILQIVGQVSLIAKPLPQGELVLSAEVNKMKGQLLLQMDRPCSLTEDGLYPLTDFKLSAKAVLFLQPLSQTRGLVKTVQVNVVPLSLTVTQQDLLSDLIMDYTLPSSPPTTVTSDPKGLHHLLALLPEKLEVVLENISCLYQAQKTNRVMSSKITRVSADTTLTLDESSALPSVDGALAVQDLQVVDSYSRRSVRLQQLRLVSNMTSNDLTNKLQVDSFHVSLWEEEVVFWSKHIQDSLKKINVKLKSRLQDRNSQQKSINTSHLFNSPLSVVTSLESSDWSLQLHTDTPTLQAKGPVFSVVMATCAGNVQWDAPQDNTTTLKSSLRLADAYIHVPGYHPTVDNPTFFRQREDSPQALPSLHNHLWGRVVSVGTLVLKVEHGVKVVDAGALEFCGDSVTVRGEGSSVMAEWSQPTLVACVRALEHLKTQYGLFGHHGNKETESSDKGGVTDSEVTKRESWIKKLPRVDLELTLTDINVFLYALTPEPPSLMIRLDAGSLSTLPSPTLTLHHLLLDDMHLTSFTQVFVCSDTASLPYGAGVLCVGSAGMTFDPQIQDVSVNLTEVTGSWTTTAHRCIVKAATSLQNDLKLLRGVLGVGRSPPTPSSQPAAGEVVAIGDVMKGYLEIVPMSVSVRVDKAEIGAQLDKRTKVSMAITNIQSSVTGAVLLASSQEIAISFDKHRIVSLYEFITRFPQEDDKMAAERKKARCQLQRERNTVLWVQASRVDFIFPYEYNFSLAYDKLTNVRKFLQKIHSGAPVRDGGRLYLLPDLSAECEDLLLQVSDDPFEVKLRANYELLCDEFDQKTQRREALDERLKQIRQQQGVTAVSGEKVQSLYSSLEVKDSEIYCQRAHKMYSCPEDIRTGLFMFTMEHTKFMALFDPCLLGEENLIKNLKEIDAQSPMPEGYSFSTLWGCYVSSSTDKLQMQLRDYPRPLIAITEATANGKMILAEQEARDREQRSAVVEVGHPWSSVTVKRKLPPLKYYYDLEMSGWPGEHSLLLNCKETPFVVVYPDCV